LMIFTIDRLSALLTSIVTDKINSTIMNDKNFHALQSL
jgi:hypothetical protein